MLRRSNVIDGRVLDRLVDERKVRRKNHPQFPDLAIYKYRAGYDFFADDPDTDIVAQCRGLVFDHRTDKIMANPPPKFFNHFNHPIGKLEELFKKSFYVVTEKLDGSCILLWNYRDVWHFSSLFSFESAQAQRALEIFEANYRYSSLCPYRTYVFEVIYPDNQVVINYRTDSRLVYLLSRHTRDGFECDDPPSDFDTPKNYTDMGLPQLKREVLSGAAMEGFVVTFFPGEVVHDQGHVDVLRIKYKTRWYFERAKLVARIKRDGLVKALFHYYLAKQQVPFIDSAAQSRVDFVEASVNRLCSAVTNAAMNLYGVDYKRRRWLRTRKQQAKEILSLNVPVPLKSALFAALDRKEETVRFQVWKTLVNEEADALAHVVTEYESALALLEPFALPSP
ncbi:MAG: hypothetical protein F4Z16_06675 [Rhodothermaceae bacterium]|nr:hypothetical protein [Rhodothermaceae bacterium]MYD66831.1 hypothetical protein [Rhodothermaceae bacterium]MYI78169.1 hypothetical protein [Gammaproteobacteria bacterium]